MFNVLYNILQLSVCGLQFLVNQFQLHIIEACFSTFRVDIYDFYFKFLVCGLQISALASILASNKLHISAVLIYHSTLSLSNVKKEN